MRIPTLCIGALGLVVGFAGGRAEAQPRPGDCNGNLVLDAADILLGTSEDCNVNGLPDECELRVNDCNRNGQPDDCDIRAGVSVDGNDDGIPDECDPVVLDCNDNGVPDRIEIAEGAAEDCDGNGVPDVCDLDDGDCNRNKVPDRCEFPGGDADKNGVLDDCEPTISDCNGNGVRDEIDIAKGVSRDCDENGKPDECQASQDCNENGDPDFCELLAGGDANGNGVLDECEEPTIVDCNGNEIDDSRDIAIGLSTDCDRNGVPDECQSRDDCNENGAPDFCEVLAGGDANGNGVLDECEEPTLVDCNGNKIHDRQDIAAGTSTDCDENGVPDECQSSDDCNENGRPDFCELLAGGDADGNGILDDCETPITDCNDNGTADAEDIASGVSRDCNGDGVPDECDAGDDCNENGIPDECEAASDCNENGEPDFCDIAKGLSQDEDGDGLPDECDAAVVVREAYENALASAIQLRSSGFVPQSTVEFLIENEAELSSDINALANAVVVASFQRANRPTGGDGGGAAGGVSSGPTSFALSSGGLFVGTMRVDLSWNNNADACRSDVSAHIFVGGVINGACGSAQIGDSFSEECLATKDCPDLEVECGTYLLECTQSLGPLTANFNTPLESICASCVEFPTQVPGDCNSDGGIDISDAVCHFGYLFLGNPVGLPCGDESASDPANIALLDWNDDSVIDISDGIASVRWQFDAGSGAPEHFLGTECTMIPTCPQVCSP